MSTETENLLSVVDDQRVKLMNALGLTTVLKVASANDTGDLPNLEGALEILEEAIQGVVEGLEPIMLNRAIAAPGGIMSTTNKLPETIATAIGEQRTRVWNLRATLNLVEDALLSTTGGDVDDLESIIEGLGEMAESIHGALDTGALADRAAELQEDAAQRAAFVTGDGPAETDDRNVASERINAERKRIFQVMGIIESVAAGLGRQVQAEDPGYPFALDAAAELLNDIAAKMELIGSDREDEDGTEA